MSSNVLRQASRDSLGERERERERERRKKTLLKNEVNFQTILFFNFKFLFALI